MEPQGQSTSSEPPTASAVARFCDDVTLIFHRLQAMPPGLRKAAIVAVEELLGEAP